MCGLFVAHAPRRRAGTAALCLQTAFAILHQAMSTKPRVFKAKLADIINLVDAIFDGNREMPGWVIMAANARGRECIDALFPRRHIAWRATDPALPKDWRGLPNINVPEVVATVMHNS